MSVKTVLRVGHRFRGVLFLSAAFAIVFLLEATLAHWLGYSSVRVLLSAIPGPIKRLVAALVAPFIHQSLLHLLENLVYFLIFGFYVEWQIGTRRFLLLTAAIGYGASWLLLLTGSVGAVGASGITHGLEALTGAIALIRMIEIVPHVQENRDIALGAAHGIPLVMGLGFSMKAIQTSFQSTITGTEAIHGLGAILGLVLGLYLFVRRFLSWSSIRPSPID